MPSDPDVNSTLGIFLPLEQFMLEIQLLLKATRLAKSHLQRADRSKTVPTGCILVFKIARQSETAWN